MIPKWRELFSSSIWEGTQDLAEPTQKNESSICWMVQSGSSDAIRYVHTNAQSNEVMSFPLRASFLACSCPAGLKGTKAGNRLAICRHAAKVLEHIFAQCDMAEEVDKVFSAFSVSASEVVMIPSHSFQVCYGRPDSENNEEGIIVLDFLDSDAGEISKARLAFDQEGCIRLCEGLLQASAELWDVELDSESPDE